MKLMLRVLCAFTLLALLAGCGETAQPLPPTSAPLPVENTPVPAPTLVPTPAPTPLPAGINYLNPAQYEVTYIVSVRGGGYKFSKLKLYQPKPVEWDAQKDMAILEVSPQPASEKLDASGNGMYYWELANTPESGKIAAFTVKFTFTAYETLTNIDPAAVPPYDTNSALYKQYTAAERFIESDDPAIQARAVELAAGETNPLLVARKFYAYIIDNSTYKKVSKGLAGAKTLLDGGKGECGDYASLFIALSRASGIPARSVVGYWAESGIDQTHVWAEFYLEGLGWVPVDATMGQLEPAQRDYYFGNMDNRRVILNKGFNLPLLPAAPDNYVAQFLQVPLYWYWGSGDASKINVERTAWSVAPKP